MAELLTQRLQDARQPESKALLRIWTDQSKQDLITYDLVEEITWTIDLIALEKLRRLKIHSSQQLNIDLVATIE